eukprot:CAMPEP_0197550334 /NCGR_PEP_ID=MMETSP1320-20131121/3963_1 /TAXON_ID=91990 /ORGANISM="Bolidomonas sp., Strain RCC2347" /LENGTH=155 /DNA_ID=CAMNT_0043110693 /DNA_START=235 /DNA_END=702 /DNA_ORIENTATION=-
MFCFSRSRRGGSSFSFGKKPSSSSSAPVRRPAASPPAPQQSSGGGMMSGMAGTIAQGMMFGTGSAIGHRAVGAVAGAMSGDSSDDAVVHQQQQHQMSTQAGGACALEKGNYFDCLKATQGDAQSCSFLFQAMQSCQQQGAQQGMVQQEGGEKSWS